MKKFKEFINGRISGFLLINPFWLEYLLNLFNQGYIGEVWEEITETKINILDNVDSVGYGIIGECLK